MAADDETCHGNANFAIICSFIFKFGEEFGLPNSIPALQRMLEDTENVDDELKEIHIKLLRKARKWFNKEKWERALVKFCHEYSSVDAWEIERFGYKKAKLSVKLELLKRLLELQFDCNAKFKGEVNKLDALSLRVLPIGRDLNGHMYWYQLDKECNLRLYMQDVEDEMSWKLLCSTKHDLEVLLENLGSKIDRKDLEVAKDEESKAESNDMPEVVNEEVKPEIMPGTDIKSEAVEEKSEECEVLKSTATENITIKQEIEEKSETSHPSDKECSMAKTDDAEHQGIGSMDVPPVTAADPSGSKISLKDCTISLQSDDANVGETNNQSHVIKPATSDSSESKTNSSSLGDKEENVIAKPPDLVVSEVQDKPEKETGRSTETSSGKSIEKIAPSLADRSEAPGYLCESKKDGAIVVERCANAKQNEGELRKRIHEEPLGERSSPMVKSSFSEDIMGKHHPENLPFSVKEAHSTKVNSAITASLLSENVSTLLDRRSVMVSKKQGEHRLLYKSPPPVSRSVSMCDEVPMDLSTTGRSRESKNEPFIIPRPEHEVPGNYKTESFITKIERQLTKMCEDNESAKFNRNDRFPFSSKHHKLRRNESFRKYHSKGIDQLHLSKMNVDQQNLGNQPNVSVIVGDKFLTKESLEQPRQSVICEIKNSKLIPNEKIHDHSDNGNHLTSSSIANSHCISSVSQKSGLQPIEKGPDHHDKGNKIQVIRSISPPDKIPFLSPRSESFNNIAVSERKNLGFRKCLLNEFKADKSSLNLASSSSQILVKDKLGSISKVEDSMPLKKLEDMRSRSKLTDPKLLSEQIGERYSPPKKCEDAELVGKNHISEEPKPVSALNKKCESTEPLGKIGEKQVGKDMREVKKSSCEDVKSSSKEINCKQLGTSKKDETCEKEYSHKGQKYESKPLQKGATGALQKGATGALQKGATGALQKGATGALQKGVTGALQKSVTGDLQKGVTGALQKGVTESLKKEGVMGALQKEGVTEALQKGVTEALQKGVTESLKKEGVMGALQKEGVTEALQKGVTEALQKGVTEALQKGVTEALQKGVTEAVQKESVTNISPKVVTEAVQKGVTKVLQEDVTEAAQKEGVTKVSQKNVTEAVQKEGVTEVLKKNVTEAVQEEGVTKVSQKGVTEVVTKDSQKDVIEAVQKGVAKSLQKEEKCLKELSQMEGRCMTKSSEEKENCVTEPAQKEETCVTKASQQKEKCATEPSQMEEKCVTKASQQKKTFGAEPSQKERYVTKSSQEKGKCAAELPQKKEKCVTEPSQKEEKCVTEPSLKEEKCTTEPSEKKCTTEPSEKKCTTEPSEKKCTTEPSEKCTTEPSEKCTTEPSEKKCTTEPSEKKCTTEPSEKKCTTEPSEKKCTTEPSEKKCTTEPSEKKCTTEPSEKCTTEPSQTEKCTTEPSQTEKCTTEPSQKEKCTTEPSQKKCTTEPSQKEKCTTEPSQKEKCTTESSQKEKSTTEPSQREKCTTEPSQREKCTTEPSQREKSTTEPSQKEKSTTEPSQKEKSTTEPSQKEKSTTEPSQKEKSTTEPSQKENCTTEPSQKENCTTESSQKEKSTTEPSQKENCTTEPSQKENCTTESSQKENCTTESSQKENCTTESSQKENCTTESSQKKTCAAESSQEKTCATESSQEKCATESSQEKCATESSQKEKCATESSQKEEKCVTEPLQKEEKCVTEPSRKKEQCVTEHLRQKDKSKKLVGACMKDESSELKSPVTESGCSFLSGENHCAENKETTKGDTSGQSKLDGKDDISAESKQDKCDASAASKKDSGYKSKCDVGTVRKKDQSKKSRCGVGTTRKKDGSRQSSSLRNERKENKGTVSGKQAGDLPLQADKASKVSHDDSGNNLGKKKEPVSEDERHPVEKVPETCESASRTTTEDTQTAKECETGKQGKNACHSDANKIEIKDSQSMCQTKQSSPVSVESDEASAKKHSSSKDVETCLEIPKLDQETSVKSCKNASSDAKSDGTVEEEKPHLKGVNKSDTVTMQARDESLKIDSVDQKVSEGDGKGDALADESISEPKAAKCKEGPENESSAKKSDESISTENRDGSKKDHQTSKSAKALDDGAGSEKRETGELARKEIQNEERAQVKSKLRRSSRTSRGYSEAPKIELENGGLGKSDVEKSKAQADRQKHDDATLNNSACPDVNTDLTDNKNAEATALNENDASEKQDETVNTANVQGNEKKRRRTERRSSRSNSRRSRNARKSVRNVPKADVSCETGVTPDKSVSNSEVTGSSPALNCNGTEKLDGLKIKFSPPKKNIEISKDIIMCDIGVSSACLESKLKCKSLTKIVNNKYFKSKVKESFSKKLTKVGSEENPICIDQEESFTVGRMRTRGRLKRECSAVAPPPPPPKEPVVKNKPAAASPNKTPQPSQSKTASKNKVQQSRVGASPASTPRKRVRGKRSSLSKTPLPDTILEIIGNSEEKGASKNDRVKKTSDKKSTEIVSAAFPVAENSESDSIPVKRSRRIQEQNQKKISQLAVEMEQEQRRLEKLAKQNAAVAKNKQKEAAAIAEKTPKPQPVHQQQARSSKKTIKTEPKQPDPVVADFKNSPRKTRNRSRNLTKMTLMYEDDSKDAEYETSRDTIKSRRRRNGRRGRKKKYKPWDLSSESSSPSEELTEEEEEEEQEELLVFNTNEDEFACEEIDENAEPVIIRRARTARKAKSASESESEAEHEPAPDDKPCASCGKYDEPEWILLCDKCDSGYHTRCLAPPLMIIPDGDWYCPPCEHAFLVDNLIIELRKLDQMLKQREREELRKQRLAYVGISLDNVLKPEKKEKQENESYEEEEESDESSEEDRIYSKRSSRTRRVVNYQFKEFDELIQSAIEEEMMEFRLPEKPEVPGAPPDSNEDSEADVVAPSRRKKKHHRLNDLDFTDVEDSDEEYKGSSMSETEVSQSPQSDGSNSRHSGSSASWRGGRKTRASKQKKHHKKSRNSGESDYLDGESFRPTTRRAAQKNISYRELSSDEEWGDDKPKKPTVKKWTKKRRQSSTSSESSDESYGKRKSKKARIVQKWKKFDSDTESEPKKARSSSRKWGESESESEPKETRKKPRGVQQWEGSESASDSGSRKAKKTRTIQKWEGSESESESDSKKSSSSDSESSGTSVQSAEKWKIKKSSEGNGIKININRKVLDSDSDDDSTSGQTRQKKKNVSRIVDSEDSEESYDDTSKKVSDEESTSESNAGQKSYKDEKTVSVKNVPSNAVKDVKPGPQITVTVAEKVPETVVEKVPPKAAPHHVGIHFKGNASPSVPKVIRSVKPLGRSLMKSDSEHKNFDSSISETFSNDSQSLQGLPTEHEEPMCESDSEPDPKLNRFTNDQYICKTEIFEKDSVYRPAKEDQSFNYTTAEEKSYQIPYTGLSSLQDYPSRPSPLKPSMVETYSNSTSPSKLTPLDSYSEASSPKGFISLDTCSSFRKSGTFVSTDPEAKPRPIMTPENYQGEIRFPQEQYPPYERPSHLSPAMCPSSPAAFPQSPSARENASPPRMYSQYPEPYAGQRSPDYYHSQQYYGREEGVQRQNYVSNYSSSETVSPYPYNTNSTQQPNGGFMIDTLLRSRNPDGEDDELTGVTDIVSYITQE